MARRPKENCPLCPPALGADVHAEVWYAYQESQDFEIAAHEASQHGSECTPAQARKHFQYHRPVQPAPKGNLRRGHALQRAQQLPERLQAMLLLVSRVPGLSGSQLAELFYWNGTEKQWDSARNACYRDLNRLMWGGFVYRYYPPAQPTPGSARRGRQENLSLYFLGRDGIPYVEVHDGYEPQRGDWIGDVGTLGGVEAVFADHDAAEIVAALSRQATTMRANNMLLAVDNLAVSVTFQPANWFGSKRAAVHFHDVLTRARSRVQPSGLAAVGIDVPAMGRSLLAPFFYEYVSGSKPAEHTAEKLLRYAELRMAGALGERFPDLRRGSWIPPILVVCRDADRVAEIQASVAKTVARHELLRDGRAPVAVIADEQTVASHGLSGHCWASLWDTSSEPRRHQLVKVLTAEARGLMGALDKDTVLSCEAGAATRQDPGGAGRANALPAAAA